VRRPASICLAILACLIPSSFASGEEPQGSLLIVGGGLRYANTQVWSRFVQLASERSEKSNRGQTQLTAVSTSGAANDAGNVVPASEAALKEPAAKDAATPTASKIPTTASTKPRIAVFPTASSNPRETGERVAKALEQYGAEAFVVPVAVRNMDVDYQSAVRDPKIVEQVRQADGIFFTGGAQERIVRALCDESGKNTPLLDAIWVVYRSGGVIAGTSAGAAIMSHVMCKDAKEVLKTLESGVSMGKEVDRGLGFLDNQWFVDQHALVRGRFARALVIMKSQNVKYGMGIDENTAVEVRNGCDATIVGEKGALVLDLSEAASDDKAEGFNLTNAKLSYLEHGDTINLKTLAVKPSREKESGEKIDPKASTFNPPENRPLFFADILGNTAVVDLMAKLMENRRDEAIGLAFDGTAARETANTNGFEFRFYRVPDSHGWVTGQFGGASYTVSNVRLDVRPVKMQGPLYK
jgi:cyanophycinase